MTILELDKDIVFGTSGSGNQKKAWIDGRLLKIDTRYRESYKERDAYIIGTSFGLNMLEYTLGECIYDDKLCKCSFCNSFLDRNNEESYTLSSILTYCNCDSLITSNISAIDYFNLVCKCTNDLTGLDARLYLLSILVFDFLIANNDRHLSNIEFIRGVNGFRFAPIFDNGQSFFRADSVLTGSQLERKYRSFKSLPFSRDPRKNLIVFDNAKCIAETFRSNCGGFRNIQVPKSRVRILNYMYSKLMNFK